MNVRAERQPIPRVGVDQIDEHLDKLARLEEIAFILDPLRNQAHSRAFTACVGARAIRGLNGFQTLEAFDFGWHIDFRPGDLSHFGGGLTIQEHSTGVGVVRAEFMMPKPAMWDMRTARGATGLSLPQDFVDTLDAGLVDDDLVFPVVHYGELSEEASVIFALGGPAPTLHKFTNLELPRESLVRGAVIPLLTE